MDPRANGPAGNGAGADKSVGADPAYTNSPPKKPEHNLTVAAVLALLAERWPQCFSIFEGRRKPIKIGIHKEILVELAGAITADELSHGLRCYCANAVYLKKLSRAGAPRYDLNGAPAGTVTAEQARGAQIQLSQQTHQAVQARVYGKPKEK